MSAETIEMMEIFSIVCFLLGALLFLRNIIWRDAEYERFLSWPARLLLYAICYALVPPAGVAIGAYFTVRNVSGEQRRFGIASLFVSAVYLLVFVLVYFGPPTMLIQYAPQHGSQN